MGFCFFPIILGGGPTLYSIHPYSIYSRMVGFAVPTPDQHPPKSKVEGGTNHAHVENHLRESKNQMSYSVTLATDPKQPTHNHT